MKSEHSLRELSDPGIQVVDTFYHRIEGYHITGNLLIFASDYQSLKKDSNRLFYIPLPFDAASRSLPAM